MKVSALCIADCWESKLCFMFFKNQTYTIDSDGPLAKLTVAPWDEFPTDEFGQPAVPSPSGSFLDWRLE